MFIFAGACIVAIVGIAFLDFLHDHRAFLSGIVHDLTQRLLNSTLHNSHTGSLVIVHALYSFEFGNGAYIGHTAAGHNALGNCRTCGRKSVVHAVFLLFHLHF